MSATISPETSTAVIPAPRRAADDGPMRRQRPADQYWNVFEACWCAGRAFSCGGRAGG